MKTTMKLLLVLGLAVIVCLGVVLIGLNNQPQSPKETNTSPSEKMIDRIIPAGKIPSQYLASTKTVTIHAMEPKTPPSIIIYKGVFREGDKRKVILGDTLTPKKSVISEKDAPETAKKALEQYGGLPPDAELSKSETSYLMEINGSTGETVKSTPVSTSVFYHRIINGMPVGGQSDKINIYLGENGTLLEIYKIWRTLEPLDTNVTIISPNKAADKLQSGQIVDPPLGVNEDININSIKLGYYETSREDPEIILQPIWIFYGKTSSGSEIKLNIYARQFAGFAQTPAVTKKTVAGKSVQEKDPFTATFTDTSDANPAKWQWDFGDGMISTEQNPTHKYKTAGTYNVTLTVWNDLGSDTITQQYVVDDAPVTLTDIDVTPETTKAVLTGDETPVIDTPTPAETVVETTGNVDNPTNSSVVTETASAIPTILLETTQNTTAINST